MGRRILITGGSGGIGRALVEAFTRQGDRVAYSWYLNDEGPEAALPIRCNLRQSGAAAELVQEVVDAWGGVDVLIHNAATGVLRPATELTLKHWRAVMEVNAQALLELVQAALPTMPSGSRVLALTSAGSHRALENYALIGASKAALESLVRGLAMELGPRGITVNAISPGVVDTNALSHFPNREQVLQVARLRTPAGRLVEPEDVAQVALFLASEGAAMVQGQVITVDGGYGILA